MKIKPDGPVQTKILPACKYAFTTVSGDINLVAAGINYLFDHWLINSDHECETQPGLEVFLDKANVCNWDHFDLRIGIPVKAIRDAKKTNNEKGNCIPTDHKRIFPVGIYCQQDH